APTGMECQRALFRQVTSEGRASAAFCGNSEIGDSSVVPNTTFIGAAKETSPMPASSLRRVRFTPSLSSYFCPPRALPRKTDCRHLLRFRQPIQGPHVGIKDCAQPLLVIRPVARNLCVCLTMSLGNSRRHPTHGGTQEKVARYQRLSSCHVQWSAARAGHQSAFKLVEFRKHSFCALLHRRTCGLVHQGFNLTTEVTNLRNATIEFAQSLIEISQHLILLAQALFGGIEARVLPDL